MDGADRMLFALTLAGYGLAALGTGVLAVSLVVAAPIPGSLAELHVDRGFGLCPVGGGHR